MTGNEDGPQGKDDSNLLREFRTAIGDDLNALAMLHDTEPDANVLLGLKGDGFPMNMGLNLRSKSGVAVTKAMAETVAELPDAPDQKLLDDLAADFAQIYLTHAARAAPTESVWLDKDHLVRQKPMFEVRAYYRRYGLKVVDWANRSDDHLVSELQFLSHLFLDLDGEEPLRDAASFLDEHLLRWIDLFAARVSQRCETDFFAGICILTASYLDELRDVLAELLGEPRLTKEDIEERAAANSSDDAELPAPVAGPATGPTW